MSDTDFHTSITATDETKSAFSSALQSAKDFTSGVMEGMKQEMEVIKKHREEMHKLAQKMSGKNKDDVSGGFDAATLAVDGFEKGMKKALSVSAITAFAVAATKTFASVEDSQNKMLATGKVTQEQIEALRKEFEVLGPVVGKHVNELMSDYTNLLLVNDKLVANFPQIEQFTKNTNASFESSLAMVNTAVAGGLSPREIPAYLDKIGTNYQNLGDAGTHAVTQTSIALRNLGIAGPLVQQQIASSLAGLNNSFGSMQGAADGMIRVIEQVAGGHGGANMQNMIDSLRSGRISLIEFFDIMMQRTDPASRSFQSLLEKDPVTRDWIKNWKLGREEIESYDKSTRKLEESPIFKPGYTQSMARLAEGLSGFARASGEALHATSALNTLADGINKVTDAIERFNKNGLELPPFLKGMMGGPQGTGNIFQVPGGGPGLGAAPGTNAPGGPQTGGPGARSSRTPTPGWFRGGTPQQFSGGGGGRGAPGLTYGQRNDALGLSGPASKNIDDRRGQSPYTGPSGPGSGAQYFSGSGGSEAAATANAQRANDADVHQMASREGRTAAFTPGAGEGAWSPYAMIPPGGGGGGGGGGGSGGGGGGGSGWGPGSGHVGGNVGGGGGRGRGRGPGAGPGAPGSGPSGPGAGPSGSPTAPWPSGAGVSGTPGGMIQTPWGPQPSGQGPHTTAPAAGGGTVSGDARTTGGGAIYDKLLASFQASGIVGQIPKDGARFGIKTGSAEEYATFGTSIANEESSFRPKTDGPAGDPGGSHGIFQYAHGQVPGGNAYDVDASVQAFVRDTKNAAQGGQIAGSVLARRFATIGNHPERAIRSLGMAREIAKGSGLRTSAGDGAPGGARVSTAPWPGEGGAPGIAATPGSMRASQVGNYDNSGGQAGWRQAQYEAGQYASQFLPEGLRAEAYSGYRSGANQGPHRMAGAIDWQLMKGKEKLPDYQNKEAFGDYQAFHQDIHKYLTEHYPELAQSHRWGGYFLHGPKNYGVQDTMHGDFNMGGAGMQAGSWSGGVSPNAAREQPGFYGGLTRQTGGMGDISKYQYGQGWRKLGLTPGKPGEAPAAPGDPAHVAAAEHTDIKTPWDAAAKDDPTAGAIPNKYSGKGGSDTAGDENARRVRAEMSKPIKVKAEIGHPQGHTPERTDRHNTRIHQQSENRRQRHASYANIGHA